jgi:hypothetical protein
MVRTSYRLRNPTIVANRRRLNSFFAHHGKQASRLPVGNPIVFGLMIMGITGLGKSAALHRALSIFPNEVVPHGPSEAAGWDQHAQIPYLVVQLPSSLGGLLHAILSAIDDKLNTDFTLQYSPSRNWSNDKLLVEVPLLLLKYSVGILVIEEIQARNFANAPHRQEMLLMFLRLLSYGIPVVLVGNPLGFSLLDQFAQDLRRLTRGEPIELMPAESVDDKNWDEGIALATWNHCPLKSSVLYEAVREDLWRNSGGIPEFSAAIGAGTLRLAEAKGNRTPDHLKTFLRDSKKLRAHKDLIEGFAQKDPVRLSRYLDVPWEEYGLRWGYTLQEILSIGGDSTLTVAQGLSDEEETAYRGVHEKLRALHRARVASETKLSKRGSRGAANRGTAGKTPPTKAANALVVSLDTVRKKVDC